MRLINEDDVLEVVERVTNEAVERRQPKHLIQPKLVCEIAGLPTVETAIHGWWCPERARDECGRVIYHCSECNFEVKVLPYNIAKWKANEKYCAGCGARMDGDTK